MISSKCVTTWWNAPTSSFEPWSMKAFWCRAMFAPLPGWPEQKWTPFGSNCFFVWTFKGVPYDYNTKPRNTQWKSKICPHAWLPNGIELLDMYLFVANPFVKFQVAYASLASATFAAGMKLYKYRPKFHLGTHLPLGITSPEAINPNWFLALGLDHLNPCNELVKLWVKLG